MNVRVRELSGVRAVPTLETSSADLALINAEYARATLAADDLHVRQAKVAHNQTDRTLERFQKAHLERFAETLPGKSLLPGHDTSALPLGRWFRADTRTRQEEFPVLVREQKDAGRVVRKQPPVGVSGVWLRTDYDGGIQVLAEHEGEWRLIIDGATLGYFTEPEQLISHIVEPLGITIAPADPDATRGAKRLYVEHRAKGKSSVVTGSAEALAEFLGAIYEAANPAGKTAEIVPGFEPKLSRVTWLEAAFYFMADPGTDAFRKNIDGGVYQDVSIGFSFDDIDCDVCKKSYLRTDCPHYRGQRLDDGRLVTLTYSGDPKDYEARETSIVYLGAQQHAELVKALKTGTLDPKALARTSLGEDLVALKEYEALARRYGHAQKSWAFPALKVSSSLGEEDPPPVGGKTDTEQPAPVDANGDMSMDLLKEARRVFGLPEGATEAEAISAMEKAHAETAARERAEQRAAKAEGDLKDAEPLKKIGEEALADLQKQIVADDYRLTGKESKHVEKLAEMMVKAHEYDELKAIAAEKRAAVLEKFPAGTSGDTRAKGGEAPDEDEQKTPRRVREREHALV